MPAGYIYILGSTTGTLYTGVTSTLNVRITQHRQGLKSGFATKHACYRLLHTERYKDIREAISREKQIKSWTRQKKLDLIRTTNPDFRDLAAQHGWQMLGPNESIPNQP